MLANSKCTLGRCTKGTTQGRHPLPSRTCHVAPRAHVLTHAFPWDTDNALSADPEVKFRRYGPYFGGRHVLDLDWIQDAPRVRVRQAKQRQRDELVEVAVLNARLAGVEPWEARRRLEYLRARRKNWEHIYHYVTKREAAVTLSLIEEAYQKVEEVLSEEASERRSVSALQQQLVELQAQVDSVMQRLETTQSRVEKNLVRVSQLKAEAAALERLNDASRRDVADVAPAAVLAVQHATATQTVTPVPRKPAAAGAPSVAISRPLEPAKGQAIKDRGLHSSLEVEDCLRNFWYPAEFSSRLLTNMMVPFDLFGEPWVLFRDESGAAACVRDTCAHRACPLSLGKVVNGQVECAYHGWRFNGAGECTTMPSTVQCRNVGVTALPCLEQDGFVWVWPGDNPPAPTLPEFTWPPAGYQVHAELMIEVPVEHGLLMENLLDLAHAPFTHTSTFAKGWPVPDMVKFHASKLLSGNWDPYPIDMSFQPPCMVLSTIGLLQPGKVARGARAVECERHLHQLHVCMPSRRGHTRLLYRMSLDFMPWLKYVPGIDRVWQHVANQVMGEDLVLVVGQQDRMQRGDDTWAHPVSYDKLAVRYRRWRNALADKSGDHGAAALAAQGIQMSAGEVFAVESEGYIDELEVNQAASS